MTPESLVAELENRGVTIAAASGELRLNAPTGVMTQGLLVAVRDSKVELLKLLEPADVAPTPGAALFSRGPGAGCGAGCGAAIPTPARAAPVAPEYSTTQELSKADAEFDRFGRVAVRTPTGGLCDPDCSPELAKRILAGGVAEEAMERFEADCGRMGRGVRP